MTRRSLGAVLRRTRALPLCLLIAVRAFAADADEAEAQFRLGIRAFQARDPQAAVAHFLASYRLAANARVAYDLALAYDQLGQPSEAYRYLSIVDDPATPAQLRATANDLRAAIERKVAVLEVHTVPEGARVFIDRHDLGVRCVTPCLLALPAGTHEIELDRDAFERPPSTKLTLERGRRSVVSTSLTQIEGTLAFTGDVHETTLTLEGSERALCTNVPCEASLAPGPYVVIAVAPSHAVQRIPVLVRARERSAVPVALVRPNGTLVVTSRPQGEVFIDGRDHGIGPVSIALPAGNHRVEVRASGYATVSREVSIAAGETPPVEVELQVREDVEAASRRVEEARVAPGSVTVITRSELEAFGYPTLFEALRGVRGLFLSDDGYSQPVDLRGFSEPGAYCSRILVLLDGRPLNSPYDGGVCSGFAALASLDDVERIEVVRGPTSALFGSGAFFATIQIVTRTGGGKRRAEGRVAAFGDSFGRVGARVEASTPSGSRLHASVSTVRGWSPNAYFAEFRSTEGETPVLDASGRPRDGHVAGGPSLAATTAQVSYVGEALEVRAVAHRYARTLLVAPFGVVVGDPRSEITEGRYAVDARYNLALADGRVMARGFGAANTYDGTYAYGAPIGLEFERFRGVSVGGELRWDATVRPGFESSLAVDVRAQTQARVDSGNEVEGLLMRTTDAATYAGALGQFLIRPSERVRVTLGSRIDYDPRVADANLWLFSSPRVALVGDFIEGGTTKVVLGKAFRAATTLERVYEGSGWLPSHGLEPEQVVSAELEHRQALGSIAVTADAFVSRIDNVIVLREPAPETFQFANSPDAVVAYGGELEAKAILPGSVQISANGALARQVRKGDELRVDTNVPRWLAAAKVVAPLSVAGTSFAVRAALEGGRLLPAALPWGATSTEPSARVDAVLAIPVPGLPVDARLGIYNLFNARTASVPSASWTQATVSQEGRSLLLVLRVATDR